MITAQIKANLSFEGMKKLISCHVTEISINKDSIPEGSKTLSLKLVDTNAHDLQHGKVTVPFEGSDIILRNTFQIIPLAPPPGNPHQYQLTVKAIDENNEILGIGQVTKQFPE